jgi:hypothetical protein
MHDVLVPLVVFASGVYIVKIISDNRLRRFLAQQGQINDNLKYLYVDRLEARVPSSLKWGMVLIALGLAILIGKIINSFAGTDEMLMVSLMFIFGGGALIAYYVFASRLVKKQQQERKL